MITSFFIILFTVLYLIPAQGQLKSELNLPRAGDELVKEQVVYCEPGEAGENQIWDFSKIRIIDGAYTVQYFTRDDWKIIGAENGKLSFLSVQGDSLLTGGYETPSHLVKYHSQGLLLQFPVAYGSTSHGTFQGRGKHHDLLESTVRGDIHTVADAAGNLILPGNDTLENVVRVHIRKIESSRYIPITSGFEIDLPANDSLFSSISPDVITVDTYQWYEEGYRYPVFETIETYRSDSVGKTILNRDAYFYHPAEQAYLSEDTANQAALERKQEARKMRMLERESNIVSFDCYPNPVKDYLEIELSFRRETSVEAGLWDMKGQLLRKFPVKTQVTHYQETIDITIYPQGYYLVKVTAGKETVSEKILKK